MLEGNRVFRAPEFLNSTAQYLMDPDNPKLKETNFVGQPAFEAGCLLFYVATGGLPLPYYPNGFGELGKTEYDVAKDVNWAAFPPDYSPRIRKAIQGLLEYRPFKRSTLDAAFKTLFPLVRLHWEGVLCLRGLTPLALCAHHALVAENAVDSGACQIRWRQPTRQPQHCHRHSGLPQQGSHLVVVCVHQEPV